VPHPPFIRGPLVLCDTHCHFFSTPFLESLAVLKGLGGPDAAGAVAGLLGWDAPGSAEQLVARWVAELDRHGVTRAALIASVAGDEASVATAVGLHPDRFVGFFLVDPTSPDAETRVGAALRDLGLRVACLFPAMHRYSLRDERVDLVASLMAARPGTGLFVHNGVLSIGARTKLGLPRSFEIARGNPLDVQPLANAYPRLPVIVPHFGAGFFREALMLADACPNVLLDTSSSNAWIRYHPGLTLEAVFDRALDVAGADRLLFGTDSSFFPRGWMRAVHERQVQALDAIGAPADVKARVLGGNFDRIFPAPL
jgi:predicted TIM-barrel fold metal-dependent hydrolase